MQIGENKYDSIVVTDSDGGVIAVVDDKEIVTYDGYKVVFENVAKE